MEDLSPGFDNNVQSIAFGPCRSPPPPPPPSPPPDQTLDIGRSVVKGVAGTVASSIASKFGIKNKGMGVKELQAQGYDV